MISLTVNSAARFHCAPDWSWDTRAGISDYDVWTVLEGEGGLRSPERQFELQRGDCFLLRPHVRYFAWHNPDQPLRVIAVHFSPNGSLRLDLHRRILRIEFLTGLLERAVRSHTRGESASASLWMAGVLEEISHTDRRMRELSRTGRLGERLEELCEEIRERPDEQWTSAALARELNVSPQHLARLFRRHTGRSPQEFVIDARIGAAEAYLRGSSLPIKRIADILGYHDEFHFSNQFRSRTGLSPARFRADRS
jgi:AraC-like DNA-binding protein